MTQDQKISEYVSSLRRQIAENALLISDLKGQLAIIVAQLPKEPEEKKNVE